MSFWYLANRLGKRFLRDVVELTGKLKSVEAGVWRGTVLGRPLWLVSNRDVPINAESAPVRFISEQSVEQTRELADIVTGSEALWQTYGPWLCLLYPSLWKELDAMAVKRKRGELDWRVDRELRAKILRATGAKGAVEDVIDQFGVDGLIANLSPEQRLEFAKRMKDVLTPEQRRDLARSIDSENRAT